MTNNRAEHTPQRIILLTTNRDEHLSRCRERMRRSGHFMSPPPVDAPTQDAIVPFGLWPADAIACELANTSDLANTPDLATTSNHMPTYPKAC